MTALARAAVADEAAQLAANMAAVAELLGPMPEEADPATGEMAGYECLYSDHRLLPGVAWPCVAIAAIGGAVKLLDALFGLLHWTTGRAQL